MYALEHRFHALGVDAARSGSRTGCCPGRRRRTRAAGSCRRASCRSPGSRCSGRPPPCTGSWCAAWRTRVPEDDLGIAGRRLDALDRHQGEQCGDDDLREAAPGSLRPSCGLGRRISVVGRSGRARYVPSMVRSGTSAGRGSPQAVWTEPAKRAIEDRRRAGRPPRPERSLGGDPDSANQSIATSSSRERPRPRHDAADDHDVRASADRLAVGRRHDVRVGGARSEHPLVVRGEEADGRARCCRRQVGEILAEDGRGLRRRPRPRRGDRRSRPIQPGSAFDPRSGPPRASTARWSGVAGPYVRKYASTARMPASSSSGIPAQRGLPSRRWNVAACPRPARSSCRRARSAPSSRSTGCRRGSDPRWLNLGRCRDRGDELLDRQRTVGKRHRGPPRAGRGQSDGARP